MCFFGTDELNSERHFSIPGSYPITNTCLLSREITHGSQAVRQIKT